MSSGDLHCYYVVAAALPKQTVQQRMFANAVANAAGALSIAYDCLSRSLGLEDGEEALYREGDEGPQTKSVLLRSFNYYMAKAKVAQDEMKIYGGLV